MGSTKEKNGDGHIIFHVGKELPERGSDLLLVPGVQNAQGRGVYFSDDPRLKYSGGEAFQKNLDITPIFCITMSGKWIKGKNKMKKKEQGGEITYHSNERAIAMRNLNYIEGDVDGVPVRYYYPKEISFFQEPDTQRMGRHVTSEFSENVLNGKINFQDAIKRLRDEFKVTEEKVDERFILEKMVEAINQKQIPMDMGISERLAELNAMLEGVERYRIVA